MKSLKKLANTVIATVLAFSLSPISGSLAEQPALPAQPEEKSEMVETVQPEVNKEVERQTLEKREQLVEEAISAVSETRNALSALEEGDTDKALEALALVTGKLELIVSRDPALALAPVDTNIAVYDVLANEDSIRHATRRVQKLVADGEFQQARPIMALLASEIRYETTSIPLATYPAAIKAIAPLIDVGKTEQAKESLEAALNTLVVTVESVPLPVVRAEALLAVAEELAENDDRNSDEERTLTEAIQAAEHELKKADLLGYGDKRAYQPMYDQLREISRKSADGGSGSGWFQRLKRQISEL